MPPNTRRAIRSVSLSVVTASRRSSSVASAFVYRRPERFIGSGRLERGCRRRVADDHRGSIRSLDLVVGSPRLLQVQDALDGGVLQFFRFFGHVLSSRQTGGRSIYGVHFGLPTGLLIGIMKRRDVLLAVLAFLFAPSSKGLALLAQSHSYTIVLGLRL